MPDTHIALKKLCETLEFVGCEQCAAKDKIIEGLVKAIEHVTAWPPNHGCLAVLKQALAKAKG